MAKLLASFFSLSLTFSFFLTLITASKYIKTSNAQIMSDNKINLQSEPINPTEVPEMPKREVSQKTQIPSDIFIGKNFKIKYGFGKYASDFSFSLSSNLVDFGILSPNNPILRTNFLTIYNQSNGYVVLAGEDQEFKSSENSSIPDTTCDNGSCTQTTSALWKETTVYGFGYRCDNIIGNDCLDFEEPHFFKQFSNLEKQERLEKIMKGYPGEEKRLAKITYKINISNTQKASMYSNVLTFLAVPNF